jgi:hypothetical protein
MDVEGLLTRVYEWIASVTALRLEQAYTFDVRNIFEVKPHTDVTVALPWRRTVVDERHRRIAGANVLPGL